MRWLEIRKQNLFRLRFIIFINNDIADSRSGIISIIRQSRSNVNRENYKQSKPTISVHIIVTTVSAYEINISISIDITSTICQNIIGIDVNVVNVDIDIDTDINIYSSFLFVVVALILKYKQQNQ